MFSPKCRTNHVGPEYDASVDNYLLLQMNGDGVHAHTLTVKSL